MNRTSLLPRSFILLTIGVALLGGLGSGLARLGWHMDPLSQDWMLVHGPLMISGFLGTLICLERAVALANLYPWAILVPVINALGGTALVLQPTTDAGKILLTVGSAGLVILFRFMIRMHPTRDVVIMALGAGSWLIGNFFWLIGEPVFQVVHLWTAFLILTIVGERLELSRVMRITRRGEQLLMMTVTVYLAGTLLTILNLDAGIRLMGTGALMIAAWLLRYDVTRRTIKQSGLTRYMAACLLIGYLWLGFGGMIGIWKGALYAGPDYGALLHAFLLGFVFSMIFGHAPIILPALTNLRMNYTPVFYVHLALLHVTLIYRMYGNFTLDFTARQHAGLLNVMAILLFMGITAITVIRSNLGQRKKTAGTNPVVNQT